MPQFTFYNTCQKWVPILLCQSKIHWVFQFSYILFTFEISETLVIIETFELFMIFEIFFIFDFFDTVEIFEVSEVF